MTPEDRAEVKAMIEDDRQETIRQTLLHLPEVVGNVMQHNIGKFKLNHEIYGKNPDFKGKEHIVASVLEAIDHGNPGIDYVKLLEKAIPEIRGKIKNLPELSKSFVADRPKVPNYGEI